jgi:hypothetical protein
MERDNYLSIIRKIESEKNLENNEARKEIQNIINTF